MGTSMRRDQARYYRADSRVKMLLFDVSNDFSGEVGGSSYNMIHPPLGLMTLSAYLRSQFSPADLSVLVVDVAIEGGFDEMVEIAKQADPDVIGFRALSHTHEQFHEAARRIKAWKPECITIGGGPYANASPDLIMADAAFDAVCLAEGEYVLRDLVQAMLSGGSKAALALVKGIHYRNPADGEIHQGAAMEQVQDLDEIPYADYGEIDLDVYAGKHAVTCILRRYAVLMASRGCPYKCVYCHVLFGKNYRYRSSAHVAGEFRELYDKHGIQDFFITDDIFNINLKHAKDVLREIIKLGIGQRIYFPNGLRGDIIDDEYLDLMQEANVVELVYAIETASPRLQKLIQKNLRMEKVRNAIVETAKRGILVNAFFMIGFPSETEQELEMTKDLVVELLDYLHFPYLNIVRAYHGSAMYKLALEMGYDEKFLLKHALSSRPTFGAIEEEINFLPTELLLSVRRQVTHAFLRPDRMERVLPIQLAQLTKPELVRKYAGYFNSENDQVESLLGRFDVWNHAADGPSPIATRVA